MTEALIIMDVSENLKSIWKPRVFLILVLISAFLGLYGGYFRNRLKGDWSWHPELARLHNVSEVDNSTQHPKRFNMCSNFCQFPIHFAEPGSFHSMGGVPEGDGGTACILVYSAYFDKRFSVVKVLTDSHQKCYKSVAATCRIWYHSYSYPFISRLTFDYSTLEDQIVKPRLGVVYYCETPKDIKEQPFAVSFIWDNQGTNQTEENWTSILTMNISQPQSQLYTFSVCVPPLFGSIRPERLIEFIEFHRMLGAEQFYFYNESIPVECNRVLQQYSRKGLVQVIKWQSTYPDAIVYHNQQIMQIDCMYRNMQQAAYVAQIDIDEVLLTHNRTGWLELIRRVGMNDTAVFMFLNRFYSIDESVQCPQLNATETLGPGDFVPTSLRRLAYHNVSFRPLVRSKILYRPVAVYRVRTHAAYEMPGYRVTVIDHNLGSLNHYRDWNYDWVTSKRTISDSSACLYGQELQTRVNMMLKQMRDKF